MVCAFLYHLYHTNIVKRCDDDETINKNIFSREGISRAGVMLIVIRGEQQTPYILFVRPQYTNKLLYMRDANLMQLYMYIYPLDLWTFLAKRCVATYKHSI